MRVHQQLINSLFGFNLFVEFGFELVEDSKDCMFSHNMKNIVDFKINLESLLQSKKTNIQNCDDPKSEESESFLKPPQHEDSSKKSEDELEIVGQDLQVKTQSETADIPEKKSSSCPTDSHVTIMFENFKFSAKLQKVLAKGEFKMKICEDCAKAHAFIEDVQKLIIQNKLENHVLISAIKISEKQKAITLLLDKKNRCISVTFEGDSNKYVVGFIAEYLAVFSYDLKNFLIFNDLPENYELSIGEYSYAGKSSLPSVLLAKHNENPYSTIFSGYELFKNPGLNKKIKLYGNGEEYKKLMDAPCKYISPFRASVAAKGQLYDEVLENYDLSFDPEELKTSLRAYKKKMSSFLTVNEIVNIFAIGIFVVLSILVVLKRRSQKTSFYNQ